MSVTDEEKESYDLYASKLFPARFDRLAEETILIEKHLPQELENYDFFGYDIVSGKDTRGDADPAPSVQFGCSPLSCNAGCEIFPVNSHCLIDVFDEALQHCKQIAADIADAEQSKWLRDHLKW